MTSWLFKIILTVLLLAAYNSAESTSTEFEAAVYNYSSINLFTLDLTVPNIGLPVVLHPDVASGVCSSYLSLTDMLASTVCDMLGYANGVFISAHDYIEEINSIKSWLDCPMNMANLSECSEIEHCEVEHVLAVACGEPTNCSQVLDGKFIRMQCQLAGYDVYQCPEGSELYRVQIGELCVFSNVCQGDSAFYQTCGCPGVKYEDGQCNSFACRGYNRDKSITAIQSYLICDGWYECHNHYDEMFCDTSQGMFCVPYMADRQSGWIPQRYICDSYNDCLYSDDEVDCGHQIGGSCIMGNKTGWLPKGLVCNNKTNCDDGADEIGCDHTQGITCKDVQNPSQDTFVPNHYRCQYPYGTYALLSKCVGYIDQMNCSFDNVLTCTVEGIHNTRVRSKWLCDHWSLCDGNEDEMCERHNDDCYIHKHRMCDGRSDCAHDEDELICDAVTTNIICQRKLMLSQPEQLGIPVDWLCDGIQDCVDGEDEDQSLWMVCGSDQDIRCYPKSYPGCNRGFVCPDKPNTFVPFERLCDLDETCSGSESKMCHVVKEIKPELSVYLEKERDIYIPPCLPGMVKQSSGDDTLFNCVSLTLYQTPDFTSTSPKVLHLLGQKRSCRNRFGAQYLMMACSSMCSEPEAICPLTKATSTECSMDGLVFALDKQKRIIKMLKLDNGDYDQYLFVCKNKKCLERSKVCNLVDDCGDGSDEEGCSNLFKCRSESSKYIAFDQRCDGKHDCNDSSDECQGCEVKDIIDGLLMKITAAVIATLSSLINARMIYIVLVRDKRCVQKSRLANQLFVTLIALGDFCIGAYLINISIVDMIYSNKYCNIQYQWLTGAYCSVLGVLSTFGTQLSLFSMVFLSLYRAYSLSNVFSNSHVSKRFRTQLICSGISLVTTSLIISVVPIASFTEDYFTNGMFYSANTIFPKLATLQDHKILINEYKNLSGIPQSDSYTWRTAAHYLKTHMFSPGYEGVEGRPLKFYGNDGVCLFKYFVTSDDPQATFTLSVLSVNILCFILITLAYIYIALLSRHSKQRAVSIHSIKSKKKISKSSSPKLQRKISLIIFSDFLCWIPFSVLCVLHALEKIDATPYYQISSIVIIPFNSVLNPLIYSNSITTLRNSIRSRMSLGLPMTTLFETEADRKASKIVQPKVVASPTDFKLSPRVSDNAVKN